MARLGAYDCAFCNLDRCVSKYSRNAHYRQPWSLQQREQGQAVIRIGGSTSSACRVFLKCACESCLSLFRQGIRKRRGSWNPASNTSMSASCPCARAFGTAARDRRDASARARPHYRGGAGPSVLQFTTRSVYFVPGVEDPLSIFKSMKNLWISRD